MTRIMTAWQLVAPFLFADVVILGRCCSDNGCTDVARWIVHWPGADEDNVKCDAHNKHWREVARHMGFALQSTFTGCGDDYQDAERVAVEAMERAARLRR